MLHPHPVLIDSKVPPWFKDVFLLREEWSFNPEEEIPITYLANGP